MGRPSKKKRVVRQAEEFDLTRLLFALRPPKIAPSVYGWDLDQIRTARDEQLRGNFKLPSQLATMLRTDDSLFVARRNRLAPLRALEVLIEPPADTAPAKRIATEADALYGADGVGLTTETVVSLAGDMVDHGIAFGCIDAQVRDDGSRIDLIARYWPIEWVRWDSMLRCFVTQVEQGENAKIELAGYRSPAVKALAYTTVPIVHGDGRWFIVQKHEHEPFKNEACVIPAGMIWGARAFAVRDWAQSSKGHGAGKLFGELPEGVPLQDGAGQLTKEAAAFLDLINAVMNGETLCGLRPAGAKTDFVANASTNWQVFSELVLNRDKAAARIYLGTDGTLGSQGGAPGVDISALFGIATTLLQSDTEAIRKAVYTGILQPWAALNFGDSSLAPQRRYQLPDSDAQTVRKNLAERVEAFHKAIEKLRANGFQVTQDVVAELAARYVVPVPTLPEESKRAPSIALAPTDLAVAVTVNEARASAGLGPLANIDGSLNPDGNLPLASYRAKTEAAAKAPEAPPPMNAGNGAGGAYRATPTPAPNGNGSA